MQFKLKDALPFGWDGLKGWAYNSKNDFANASAAYVEIDGAHGSVKSTKSDLVYFVLEGSGEFILDGKNIKVEKMDTIIVPKNTPFNYQGKMKLFLVHCPAYEETAEIKC
ncbi:cupin domain-containing protein [Candidatus Micrarchaeota archaeon]|nr:cupin domain-containing protein [Candidatus Micrarchaeota archaeon]MBU1930569.1 cupin domain-containing protein [Candidatus Micrarchaeota archaeon]